MTELTNRPLTESEQKWVEENLPLAKMYSGKYSKLMNVDFDEVFSDAVLGLIRAAKTYDPEKAAPSTYITIWVKQSILRERQSKDFVRRPSHIKEMELKMVKASRLKQNLHGRDATNEELKNLKYNREIRFEKVKSDINQTTYFLDSFETNFDEESSKSSPLRRDVFDKTKNYSNQEEYYGEKERYERVLACIEQIPNDRNRDIFKMYFGIGEEPRTLEKCGEQYGLTRERVRQIVETCKQFIKNQIGETNDSNV